VTEQDRVFAKCAWRLVPFMALLYVVNYIDRVNVGFAAITMNKELGFSPSIYGFGAGIFFLRAARNNGITALRMVHDCYATHAADAEKLSRLLREQFVELYTKTDILQDHFKWVSLIMDEKVDRQYTHAMAKLVGQWLKNAAAPAVPKQGAFNIADVKDSEYFFC
jgi:DNA-directed RNA polymerase